MFCGQRLQDLPTKKVGFKDAGLRVCKACGWWCAYRQTSAIGRGGEYFSLFGACAQLKVFDPVDIRMPLDDVRQFLVGRYDNRLSLHPRVFEEVVASVFQSTGFCARVTSYQADGGIDVILDGPNDETIGVQVKRYRSTIHVEQIRALAGALLLAGHTKGIFVATSSYSSAAKEAAMRYSARGLPIKLIDAPGFYDALLVAQRACYKSLDELTNEIGDVSYESIYEDEGPTYLFL